MIDQSIVRDASRARLGSFVCSQVNAYVVACDFFRPNLCALA
jgi:hypothetical protein